jgi:hypothetical protein
MRPVIALTGCLCLFLQGCTAMQAVPVSHAGDPVATTTRTGEVEGFKVAEVWALGGALLAVALTADGEHGESSD